jgi:hypothetical protein
MKHLATGVSLFTAHRPIFGAWLEAVNKLNESPRTPPGLGLDFARNKIANHLVERRPLFSGVVSRSREEPFIHADRHVLHTLSVHDDSCNQVLERGFDEFPNFEKENPTY